MKKKTLFALIVVFCHFSSANLILDHTFTDPKGNDGKDNYRHFCRPEVRSERTGFNGDQVVTSHKADGALICKTIGDNNYLSETVMKGHFEKNGFRVDSISVYHSMESESSEKVPTVIVTNRETTRWSIGELSARIDIANDLYFHSCDIEFSPIYFVRAHKTEFDYAMLTTPNWHGAVNPMGQKGLFIVGIHSFIDAPTRTALAGAEYWVDNIFQTNTILLSYRTVNYENKRASAGNPYNILSHEIAHIFLNEPHNSVPGNILDLDFSGLNITPEQCSKMKQKLHLKK